jgi:hypothetical protein
MTRKASVFILLALGCSSDSPSDVAGTYTLALTVQQTECGILAGQVGDSSSGVGMVVTQSGSDVTGQVQGLAGLALGLAMGSDTFTGKVAGASLDLAIAGTMAGSSGTCAFTRNARMQATLSGDVLTGTVTYTFATNRTADCGTRDTCKDVQRFNGTRPPRVSP